MPFALTPCPLWATSRHVRREMRRPADNRLGAPQIEGCFEPEDCMEVWLVCRRSRPQMCPLRRYDPGMDEHFFAETSAWLTQAGLAGTPENEIFSVFCDRCLTAGIPVG